MQNRNVMLLCNLKPRPLAGILSEAMVMCAKSGGKVELVEPPEGSVPGDRIIVEGHEGEPDPELKPKKKMWVFAAHWLSLNFWVEAIENLYNLTKFCDHSC